MSTRVLARREPGAGFACAAAVGCRATFADMESPVASSSSPAAGDDYPRVKFLCSFGGSILPRPLDGRLRYVGGETRIVPVPRDISYEDFLARMRELFEGASIIKYQQPDEDLDALVSVVNDDDMMNMMEEYDKLGTTGEGFTRLRIFLFSQPPEADLGSVTLHDERETERRYVDALNSLPDTRSPPSPDVAEAFFAPMTIDGGIQSQVNLHHLTIPHSSHGQRFNEMDSPWNPAYFSPRHALDSREFPPSPSSMRFHVVAGEFGDRMQDEYARQTAGHHLHPYEHQSLAPPVENFVWLPPGSTIQEKSGFPSNLGHSHAVMEGNNICEHCHRATFHRNQGALCDTRYLDPRWKHGQTHLDQPNAMNEYGNHFPNSCVECYVNQDSKLDHGVYTKEQNEHHRPFYNEIHGHERGWLMHNNQLNHRIDDSRFYYSGIGRVNEPYTVDSNMLNIPLAQGNVHDGHSLPSNFIGHDDKRYFQHSTEAGNELFHVQQNIGGAPYTNIAGHEDSTIRYANQPSAYGTDNLYQVPQNLPPIPSLRRNAQVPSRPGTSYESSGFMRPNDGSISGFERYNREESPRFSYARVDDQTPNDLSGRNTIIAPKMFGFEDSAAPDLMHDHVTKLGPSIHNHETLLPIIPDSVPAYQNLNVEPPPQAIATAFSSSSSIDKELNVSQASSYHQFPLMGIHDVKQTEISKEHSGDLSESGHVKLDLEALKLNEVENTVKFVHVDKTTVTPTDEAIPGENLNFLPELIASVTEAVLKGAEEVITKAQEDPETGHPPDHRQEDPINECTAENANQGAEADTDGDGEHEQPSKIEPTTAEAEALDKGLQTIRNDDLEEIRELGSGTYGSVFYGKWKGSDVAIKRIKASCFAGKPSERERLIADFWKEALIMSSLHHPNVVSFYGVVRDGPDGSLATVTEFMVNGSLKQFLQKKDRTIDRRKRLIIAMDAAFGMEYLHSKNIVHFDMKCENLLVNMRDPQRPICKIGDLGLSKVKQHTLVSGGIRGTLPWMAPELLSGKSNMVSEKIDVYSFGIVMWELLTGEEPYADMRGASIIGGIVSNTLRPKIPTWCDPEWKALMESCWSCDPALRPSFSEVSQKLRKMAAAINLK